MEKVNSDFEDLILINFHHHKNISKSHLAYFDSFFTSGNCHFEPIKLIFEELRIEVGYSSCQDLEDISISFFDWIEHMLHFLIIVGKGNEVVEFLCDSLEHEEILSLLIFMIAVDRKTGDLNQASQSMIS